MENLFIKFTVFKQPLDLWSPSLKLKAGPTNGHDWKVMDFVKLILKWILFDGNLLRLPIQGINTSFAFRMSD